MQTRGVHERRGNEECLYYILYDYIAARLFDRSDCFVLFTIRPVHFNMYVLTDGEILRQTELLFG
jgi:hypothetical protein